VADASEVQKHFKDKLTDCGVGQIELVTAPIGLLRVLL